MYPHVKTPEDTHLEFKDFCVGYTLVNPCVYCHCDIAHTGWKVIPALCTCDILRYFLGFLCDFIKVIVGGEQPDAQDSEFPFAWSVTMDTVPQLLVTSAGAKGSELRSVELKICSGH